MTRISIVTPSLNQGRFLGEAMESVRMQQHPEVEHLILDGGSTDETTNLSTVTRIGPMFTGLRPQTAVRAML
jgi:hypothetical protein